MWERHLAAIDEISRKAYRGRMPLPQLLNSWSEINPKRELMFNPVAKTHKEKSNPDTSTQRRDFLSFLWVGLGLAAFAEVIWLVGSFLRPQRKRAQAKTPETLMEAGPVAFFAPRTRTAIPRGRV
jgi:hypothetical protein